MSVTVRATLELSLDRGHSVAAADVGRMLIAWADAVNHASIIIDPATPIAVDLTGAEAACLRLDAILRFLDSGLDKADSALTPYPRLKAALALNVFNVPGAVAGGVIAAIIVAQCTPAQQPVPAKVEKEAREAEDRLRGSAIVGQKVRQFYRSVDASRSVTGLRMYEEDRGRPVVEVARARFPEASGLWTGQEPDLQYRLRSDVWDIIVTKPTIVSKPRIWEFTRDGLRFKAKMVDPHFLSAMRERTLPLQVHEGTLLRARVQWTENLEGDEWVADAKTYRVVQVLWPTPLNQPAPLALIPDATDGDDH